MPRDRRAVIWDESALDGNWERSLLLFLVPEAGRAPDEDEWACRSTVFFEAFDAPGRVPGRRERRGSPLDSGAGIV